MQSLCHCAVYCCCVDLCCCILSKIEDRWVLRGPLHDGGWSYLHVMPRMYKKYRNIALVINVTFLCLINTYPCREKPLSHKAWKQKQTIQHQGAFFGDTENWFSDVFCYPAWQSAVNRIQKALFGFQLLIITQWLERAKNNCKWKSYFQECVYKHAKKP